MRTIKLASENILRRIGLNLTEATELFLRRMIIDQRIPFDVVAVDNATFTQLVLDWEEESHAIVDKRHRGMPGGRKARTLSKREQSEKEFKRFFLVVARSFKTASPKAGEFGPKNDGCRIQRTERL